MKKFKAFFKSQKEKDRIKDAALALGIFALYMSGLVAIIIFITFGIPHIPHM